MLIWCVRLRVGMPGAATVVDDREERERCACVWVGCVYVKRVCVYGARRENGITADGGESMEREGEPGRVMTGKGRRRKLRFAVATTERKEWGEGLKGQFRNFTRRDIIIILN